MEIHRFVGFMATGFELAGVGTMVLGALVSLVLTIATPRRQSVYRDYRHRLGRSIILGLEFLIAADILRTITEVPTLDKVGTLAGIVLIRTFLSFSLEVELEGRWPWRRAAAEDAGA